MSAPTLADHLRRATRHGTARLPEEQVFALGRDLARELARAHAESPPRHPLLDPALVPMAGPAPRLEGGSPGGSVGEDLFQLGALLHSLLGHEPHVSWRLDGPPSAEAGSFRRRNVLATLASPSRLGGFGSAAEAAQALEAAMAPRPGPAPWPCFRGGAARAGAVPSTTVVSALAPLWHARVGAVVASPALTADMAVAAAANGRLLFLDRASGRVVHELAVASALESSPALADELLVLGTDEGELLMVDLERGTVRRRLRLGGLVRSSPLVVDGRVLVGTVDGKAGALVAADLGTGKTAWSRKLGAVFSSPAVWEKRVVVGSDDGALHAFDLATGAPAWSFELGAKVRATPAVADGLAVVGDFAGRLAAVRLEDGAAAWRADLGHPMYSSPCPMGAGWAVGCHEGHVHGVGGDGAPAFESVTHGPVISSPTAVGAALLVGSTDGALYVLTAEGDVRHRLPLAKNGVSSSAAVDGDTVYVGSADGMHALRLTP